MRLRKSHPVNTGIHPKAICLTSWCAVFAPVSEKWAVLSNKLGVQKRKLYRRAALCCELI